MSNGLRMPFAEWLFRMSEAHVPYQARSLATYAVLFRVTENDELAVLCGMDTKGNADKTYNKWKRHLSDNGWVRVIAETIGRKTSIEITPAVGQVPVTFTDVKPRDARKFYAGRSYDDAVEATWKNYDPAVETTDEARNSYAPAVEATGASRALIESSLREDKPLESNNKSPFTPQSSEPRVTFENGRLTLFNGLKSEWLELFGGDELKLNLALKQAAGYVQPNSFTKSLEAQVSAQLAHKVADKLDKDERYAKAVKTNAKPASGSKRMSLQDIDAGVDAAFERQHPKTPRIAHER